MNDDAAFWRAIEAAPGDDLPVLVFCDRLDDRGDLLAATLRKCVADGRRPGVTVGGLAFWVTTTTAPVANRSRREGRRHVPCPLRPQPSWLAGVYWRYLSGAGRAVPNTRCATAWFYPDVGSAYRDLHAARGRLAGERIDPDTGRSQFAGLTGSSWRDEARRVIAVALAKLPEGADLKAKRKAVSAAYPFGQRRHHPYKMFLVEARLALGPQRTATVVADPADCSWCDGRGCVACAGKRFRCG